MKSNKKRIIVVLAILTMAVILSCALVACNKVDTDKTGTDADMEELEGIYYAVKNGKFESDNWFNISKDGTWTDDDDLNGTWTVRGNRICFNWAFSLDGIIDGDSFYLIELDEVVEYVRRDSAPKQGEFWTDKYVILLDTNGGSVSKEILKYYKGDKVNLPTPEKENEKFKGWFDFFGNKYSTGSSMSAQNIVLYAKWEKKVKDYSDEYVFFSPAIEGKKHSDEYYYLYPNISKYIYVELTCDSVGGKYNLGTPSNFDLLHHIDMKYHVQSSDYQLKWYYGDWSQPNGSQTFTLNYGSNIQLLAVENSQGQIQCRYLLDFYVKRDVEVELYRSISATSSYETVRGYVDEMIDEKDLEPYEYDGFDCWLCYDSTTKSYKPYDFTTVLTGDIALYQSHKSVEINVDLNGGTMTEASLRIKPYEEDQILPVAEKEGYDFIGWRDSDGNYYIGYDGRLLFAVANDKMPKKLTASFIPKKYYASISGKNVKFIDTKVYVIYGFTSVDKIGYKIAANIDNEVTNYLFEIGDEFYVSGYAIEGVYDGINKLNEEGKALILTQDLLNKTLSLNMIKFPIKLEKNIDVAGSVKYDDDVAGSVKYDNAYIGAELSITATTEAGFTFMGWYDGDTLLTSEDTYTFVLSTENKTYTAKWNTSYIVPEGTTSIGVSQFKNWGFLTSITIPDSVTSIGDYAFYNCTGLTSITIPDSVKSVGSWAFRGCIGLTSVTIPDSVTSIGPYAFYGCNNLQDMYITDIVAWCNISGLYNLMEYGASKNLYINNELVTSIIIPNGVTVIPASAFRGCTGLTSITIPDSVTSIGFGAFSGCSKLTSITIPDSVTRISGEAFLDTAWYNNQLDGLVYAGKVAYKYKGTMPNNTSIVLREGTLGIADYAFRDCTGLTSITIPDSVTSIGNYAFRDCTGLTSVTIPDSVTSIGYDAFENCTGLTSITIPNSVTSIGDHAFYNCTGLMSVTIGGSVTSIGSYAFYNCTGLTSITIPDSVKSIGNYAFRDCTRLTSVTIGDSVTSIGASAFYNTAWYNNQPNGLVYAGKVAYKYKGTMPSNTSIVLRAGTLGIAGYAFSGCTGLKSITIPDSVTSIGEEAFAGCSGLTSITVAKGNTKYHSAGNCLIETESKTLIAGCKNSIIPTDGSVTSIGEGAFYNCTGLTNVTIPDSVTSIGYEAFYNCTGLKSIKFNGTKAQWNAISKGGNWKYNVPSACKVICTDGKIPISGA